MPGTGGIPLPSVETKSPRANSEIAIYSKPQAGESKTGAGSLRPGLAPRLGELAGRERAVPLGTDDPFFAPYTRIVKQFIEARWQYPELALRYGLQGKTVIEFVILANGGIEQLALVQSSGSNLLDDEALHAIRTAAPFRPIPPAMNRSRLRIIAGFLYYDGRFSIISTP